MEIKGNCNAVKIYVYTIQFLGKRMNFFSWALKEMKFCVNMTNNCLQ